MVIDPLLQVNIPFYSLIGDPASKLQPVYTCIT